VIPVERVITKQPAVRPIALTTPKFFVVTESNFEDVKKKLGNEKGQFVLYAITPTGYKALLKNNSEIERYVKQSSSTIVYYESLL
jgi:hypothetical protein